jgi:hypothetical protein
MKVVLSLFCILFLVGCNTIEPYDYTLYKKHMPKSILVVPPTNQSNDVKATYGYYSTISRPLAELGYYVYPIGVVDSFFKENGVTLPAEMQAIPLERLYEIYGADSVMYIDIINYGATYMGIFQATVVSANISLVDSQTGNTLWNGKVKASQSSDGSQHGLAGMLVAAAIKQIVDETTDGGHSLSRIANNTQLKGPNMLLLGPRKAVDLE